MYQYTLTGQEIPRDVTDIMRTELLSVECAPNFRDAQLILGDAADNVHYLEVWLVGLMIFLHELYCF